MSPIYSFRCSKCEHEYEQITNYNCDGVKCPECGCPEWEKLITSFGGYQMRGDNSASVRPKGAGYKTKRNVSNKA